MKTKHYGIMVNLVGSVYKAIQKKPVNISKRTVKFNKKKAFIVDFKNPALVMKRKNYYIFDMEGGQIGLTGSLSTIITPEMLDTIVGDEIILQIANSQKRKIDWIDTLIKIFLGLGFGITIGIILVKTGAF